MKKILLLVTIGIVSMSCSNNDNNKANELLGQWQLSEVLSDPGDGSGTFQPVESEKILLFNNDNKVYCNGTLCYITAESDVVTISNYNSQSKTITSECTDTPNTVSYEIVNGELILNYQCIEGCKAKYRKLPEETILQ
jgi:hypothetical protein